MPKGYVIFTEKVKDEGGMGAYVQAALPTLAAAGATPIVFGPPEDVLEGEWHGNQTVILEFASVEAATFRRAAAPPMAGERRGAA
jgi:uncharacterized protein (DUF1330 family)